LVPSDLGKVAPMTGQYTVLTNERGGVVDDIIFYERAPDEYLDGVQRRQPPEGFGLVPPLAQCVGAERADRRPDGADGDAGGAGTRGDGAPERSC
jgi:hypothetical protein